MRHDALDQLRRENPVPDAVPTMPLEMMLRRLDEEPPAAISKSAAQQHGNRGPRSRTHRVGAVVPALSVAVAIAIGATILLSIRSRATGPHPTTHSNTSTVSPPPAGSGPAQTLSASAYAFAVGGDSSPGGTSRVQASSGLLLFRADQVLRGRCMSQRGFRYIPDPTPRVSVLPSATGYPSTFYPQPMLSAYPEAALLTLREHEGFDLNAGSVVNHTDQDPDDRYLKTLPPAGQKRWLNAWMGHNGCYGAAETQLFGSQRAANLEQLLPSQIYDYLNSTVYTSDGAISASNPRTADATAAWSRCMRTATGRTWATENALISSISSGPIPTRLRYKFAAAEISLAVADTRCAYSTGQAQAFAAAFRIAATHLPVTLQTKLRFLLAHRHAWVTKAARILASPTP